MNKYFWAFLIVIALVLGSYIYKAFAYVHITAKFQELRPFHNSLPVYYKGIIVGAGKESKHSHDYKHTIMKISLYSKKLLLPINTQVLLKKEKRNKKEYDFLELIYPSEPSSVMLANGAQIEGKATVDMDTFFTNQHPDDIETLRQNLVASSENLNSALESLGLVFATLNSILEENQQNLYQATGNLSKASGNLNHATKKVNKALRQEMLNNAFDSIEASMDNLKIITSNLDGTIQGVNTTLPQINTTLSNVQGITCNVDAITCGIKRTLSKPFGGLRLFFGKVIN